MQFEAALAVDAANTLRVALSNMAAQHPDVFRHVVRNGHRYNNGSRQIDCDADPVMPCRHGHDVMKAIRQVNVVNSVFELSKKLGVTGEARRTTGRGLELGGMGPRFH